MNFLRAYFNVFLVLCFAAFVGTVALIMLYVAIYFHIVGQHDFAGALAIGFLSGTVTTLLLSPLIWWYLDKYL